MINLTNDQFLQTLFGPDYGFAHVTSFSDDPANISNDRRGICWGGGYHHHTYIQPGTNQYFTISTFNADDQNKSRRRKVLFRATHVIVADDVREKLPVEQVERLPAPTYKLETSPGSEQWGWVLDYPETGRHKVDNLLDGLVEKGLAPTGKDPGMKGVTRYVRLPEGYNTKASRVAANKGFPPQCRVVEWNPDIKVSIDELAIPFEIDLNAERKEGRIDGATVVFDHPLLRCGLKIKNVLSDGRFDITCPWVDNHTGQADDGAAVFTNNDGSIGFKCHHGSCQQRTGRDLLNSIEERQPGFIVEFNNWKMMRSFRQNILPDFMGQPTSQSIPTVDMFLGTQSKMVNYQELINTLRRVPSHNPEAVNIAYAVLKAVDNLDYASRMTWHNQVKDYMNWTKSDMQHILDQQRPLWYPKERDDDFYEKFIYVSEQNQFYNPQKKLWLTPEAFQNTFGHYDAEAKMEALYHGKVRKVDRVDYAPGMPEIFTENGVVYLNCWTGDIEKGVPGDVARWLDHFDVLGWKEYKKHLLQWMAFTLRHPERKINHIIILGGGEGNGKDFLLYPLTKAMKHDQSTIDGDELLSDYNGYMLGAKYLHINETNLGDRREATAIDEKLKRIAANPPDTQRVNEKHIKAMAIRNIVNVSMSTNSAVPIRIMTQSRRYFAVWTEVSIRGKDGQMTSEWQKYWKDRWGWMRDQESWKACVHYLMTQVDLADFDPKENPLVTDYMMSIQEASQDPIAMVIREFIEKKRGKLAADIVTPKDVFMSLDNLNLADVPVNFKSRPSAQVIGKVMKQNNLGYSRKMWDTKYQKSTRVWILRNEGAYLEMNGVDMFTEYERQHAEIRSGVPLSVVK